MYINTWAKFHKIRTSISVICTLRIFLYL